MDSNALTNTTCGTVTLGDGLQVRRLGFGGMRLTGPDVMGPPADVEQARAVLRRVVDLGVNLIDTADAYGPDHNESLIKEALSPYPDDVVIATKGGMIRGQDGSWNTNGHPDHLRTACEGSLRRLGIETIDLYQFHRPDPDVAFEDSVGALIELRDEGKIANIGLSNVTVEQYGVARAMTPVASVQNRYNIRDRQYDDVLQACESDGIAFMPFFPLQGFGFTSGTKALSVVGEPYSATPAQIALAWLLQRSPVMLPIPGTSSIAHLEENVAAAQLRLSANDIAHLETADQERSSVLGRLRSKLRR